MNEIALSDNLAQIEYEIKFHAKQAGQSVWEIGRRLNHVKEHDLAHGKFLDWLGNIGISRSYANRFMKIAKELDDTEVETSALRKYYNDTITDYNKLVNSFPTNIIGRMCKYKEKTYFESKADETIGLEVVR